MVGSMNPGEVVRAVRWARRLSQRDLATITRVPSTTIDRIESGYTSNPRLGTIEAILTPTGYRLVVVNQFGRLLRGEAEHDDLRDRADRRFPAHLEIRPVVGECEDAWWGWRRIAWLRSDPGVPDFSYERRRKDVWADPYYASARWDDAT
jgi:transcriptional regulator with XRE-family HTH domain